MDAGRVVELIHLCLSFSSGNLLGKRHVDIKFERRHATLEVFQRHGPDPPMAFRRSVAIVSSMAHLLSVSLMPALMEFAASYKDLASVMAMAPVALLSVTLVARKEEMIHDTNVDAKAVVPNMQVPSADGGSAHVDPLGASICGGKPSDDIINLAGPGSFVWGLIKFSRFGLPMPSIQSHQAVCLKEQAERQRAQSIRANMERCVASGLSYVGGLRSKLCL